MSNDALVLSVRQVGGVRDVAAALRMLSLQSVLVSALPDDRNQNLCNAHVVTDWEADLPTVTRSIEQKGVMPIAVINFVEPLIPWQCDLLEHYGLPGSTRGLRVLASKLETRRALLDVGVTSIAFGGGRLGDLTSADVAKYPVIVKPSRDSGGSRSVMRADSPAQFEACLATLLTQLAADTEIVVEEFIDGIESSMDGPVLDGAFHPLLHVEKIDHDDIRHHDAGLLVSPPVSTLVQGAAATIAKMIDRLSESLALDGLWLHVEARTRADGSTEILEINPRPGGRLYRQAVMHTTNIDPVDLAVRMAVAGQDRQFHPAEHPGKLVGMVVFEAAAIGKVSFEATAEDLKALPGVLDAYVLDGISITSLSVENNVAEALIEGADLEELRTVERAVRRVLRHSISS